MRLGYIRMKCWLALFIGLMALARATRSPLLQEALDTVLEDFHSRSLVQFVFKEQAVREVIEELPTGTYIQLEVDLVQTICKKQQWKTQSCRARAGGRRQKCLACFMFGSSDPGSLLGKSLRCLSEQNPVFQAVRGTHEQDCQDIKKAEEEEPYLPGKFAFSVGLPH